MKKVITTVALACISLCTFAQIPTNGLVAYYPFNGNANDASGNGKNGTAQNISFVSGQIGQCANFDGTAKIDVPSSSLQGLSNFSISYWVKLNSSTGRQVIGNLWSGSGASTENIIFDFNQSPNKLMSQLQHNTGRSDITNSNLSNLNTWYYCVHIQDASRNKHEFYVNNVLVASNSISARPVNANQAFQLGHYQGSLILKGQLDEFRIYNRVLSVNEIAQLNCEPFTTTSTTTQSACSSYTWNGITYTSSGTYTKSGLKNKAGCDSTATLNLTIIKPTTSTTIKSACSSFTWNGTVYTKTGTYTKTGFKNKGGCDSTAILALEIEQTSTSTTTQSACSSFTWNGNIYTQSGTYTKTGLKNRNGCDSTAILNLTINPLLTISITNLPNTISTQSNKVTLVGSPAGGTFSGLGVIGNQLDPKVGKLGNRTINYSYTNTTNNCSNSTKQTVMVFDTVGNTCGTYDTLYIKTNVISGLNITENTFKIYPNPVSDFLVLENTQYSVMGGYSMQIVNILGQEVYKAAITQNSVSVSLAGWDKNSVYFVKLLNAQGIVVESKKIVLQ